MFCAAGFHWLFEAYSVRVRVRVRVRARARVRVRGGRSVLDLPEHFACQCFNNVGGERLRGVRQTVSKDFLYTISLHRACHEHSGQ